MSTGWTRWSCPLPAPHGVSTWSTAITTLAAVRSRQPWPVTRPSPFLPATPLSCPWASPSWDAPIANQRSSSWPTPSSREPWHAARPATWRQYRQGEISSAGTGPALISPGILPLGSMSSDKVQHLPPGVGGCLGKFGSAAVEETVSRFGVDDDFMLDARFMDPFFEVSDLAHRAGLV